MITLSTRLPPAIIDEIEDYIEKGVYGSRSDFLKDAVRFRLFYLKRGDGSIHGLKGFQNY